MDAQPPALRWARRHVDLLVAWEPVNRSLTARLRAAPAARTRSFAVFRGRATTLVLHALPRDAIDNDIGELIADELVRPGIVNGPGAFERCFAGLVESTGPSPQAAWRRFYVNTLRALRAAIDGERGDGPVATFAHIYRHAEQLACGASVLDVGSCFAFFPLLLAGRGDVRATASDADPSTVELGRRMAAELALPVAFARADVTRRLPFAPASFDTVTALHVLEHLPARDTGVALTQLCLAARARVILAVPLESPPDPVYGHLQAFDLDRLGDLADRVPGWRGRAHEHLGGWLVLEREACRVGG